MESIRSERVFSPTMTIGHGQTERTRESAFHRDLPADFVCGKGFHTFLLLLGRVMLQQKHTCSENILLCIFFDSYESVNSLKMEISLTSKPVVKVPSCSGRSPSLDGKGAWKGRMRGDIYRTHKYPRFVRPIVSRTER